MWRSKARILLLRSPRSHSQVPSKTLTQTLIPPSKSVPSRWVPPAVFQSPRFFSVDDATNPSFESVSETSEVEINGNGCLDENPSWNFEESDVSPIKLEDGAEKDDAFGGESGDSSLDFGEGNDKSEVRGESLSSLWEECINGEESVEGTEVEIPEIDIGQVENVLSLLQSTLQDPIELSLDKLELTLSEEFVARVLQDPNNLGENLIDFFKWALKNDESVKNSRTIELLVRSISNSTELTKKEAYLLWDLVKDLGKEKGLLNTEILNEMISMFWLLGKAKAGLEVFNKFDEFGCYADGNTYYYTIEALGKRSMFDIAWSVCEKMLNAGSLPDSEKIGKIITFFCKGKKVKEAHLVYLMAKEKKICPQRSSLDFLIGGLTKNDETVPLAMELLEDYPRELFKYANKTFALVVKGLCRIKDPHEAKKLLLRMVDSGPAPGNAVFNYVITALSKGGEMEDAIALMKVMENRGLRPDVYTYTVIMSGFAKGGLINEAYKIFCEAKKRHSKLSPVTYHILIRGYSKMEEFEKALECMKEMKEDGLQPNTDEYNKMIQSLCLNALDWCSAEKLLEEMKESGLYLKGLTRSLIAAVKKLEEEETQSEGVSLAA